MKKLQYSLIFILLAAFVLLPSLSAQNASASREKSDREKLDYELFLKLKKGFIPEINSPLNDYANIIPPAQEKTISDTILAHRKKTGVQMAVLTVYTIGDTSIEEFSLKAAEKWGGGTKERDDGLLFTVAVSERRMRIEVGYGLEGYITDLKAGRILDGIREDFRNYKYGNGIQKAVEQIIRATDEVRPGAEAPATVRMWGAFAHVVDCYILFFLLGGIFAVLLILGKDRNILSLGVTIVLGVLLFMGLPILFQFFFHGAWYWTPTLYLMGVFAGLCIIVGISVPKKKKKKSKVIALIVLGIPILASMIATVYFIQIVKPVAEGTSKNETILLGILIATNILQFFILPFVGGGFEGEGGASSYSSGGSSYSSSGSSSDSSGSSSYSGGGGGFGGGGASSSW